MTEQELKRELIEIITHYSYSDLTDTYIRHLNKFKNDAQNIIDSIDIKHYYQSPLHIRDLKHKIELLEIFDNFIQHIGMLQGTLEEWLKCCEN